MYIIAIAWIYVVTLMAATEKSVAAGILTFLFYGLVPCALLLWILGVNHRRYIRHKKNLLEKEVGDQYSADTKRDE
jgi:hypothetical protein